MFSALNVGTEFPAGVVGQPPPETGFSLCVLMSCARRSAQLSPAGPAPTMRTSVSRVSRVMSAMGSVEVRSLGLLGEAIHLLLHRLGYCRVRRVFFLHARVKLPRLRGLRSPKGVRQSQL